MKQQFKFSLQRFAGETFIPDEGTQLLTVSGNILKPANGTVLSGNTMSFRISTKLPENRTAPVNLSYNFNVTWQQVSDIIEEGSGPTYLVPGDTINITLDNSYTTSGITLSSGATITATLLGINHNSTTEGTNRGHFMISPIGSYYMYSSSSSGWSNSTLRSLLNDTIFYRLPSSLRSVIKKARKFTDNASSTTGAEADVTKTEDNLWLLAEFEVFGVRRGANSYEQTKQAQYDYYKPRTTNASRIQYNSEGSAIDWWLRSPFPINNYFNTVDSTGNSAASSGTTTSGVIPCFCVGADL